MINSLGHTVFPPRVSEVGKIQPFRRKNRFLVTLEDPREKTGVGHGIKSCCK